MASSSSSSFHPLLVLCFFFFFFTVNQEIVLGSIILEEGYTVSTILNGNKHGVSPFLIAPQFVSSDLILLDNLVGRFYTLSFSSSEEGVIKKLAGSGKEGYEDGELELAKFNKVTNFAVDFRGNIYVADVQNHKIRKISKTGVTTIAGGYSEKPGNKDGPAQNASFSSDFRLTFVPERCALIISDRANNLIRQINLKAEDCAPNSHSGLEKPSALALVIGLSGLLLGLVVGFVSRPYITSRGGMILLPCQGTWNHCLMSLVRQVLMLCFGIRNAVVSLPLYMLLERLALLSVSTISLMFSRTKKIELTTSYKKSSLLDFDNLNSSRSMKADLLKDLISFDEGVESLGTNSNTEPKDVAEEKTNVGSTTCSTSNIDKMVQANLIGFSEQVRRTTTPVESPGCNVGLVKRKSVGY